MTPTTYDIAIIGGGINGAGIARDAAGRGYKTILIEKGDLAGGTSSGSTKLIHGGLRYLEYYKFSLVREALLEREKIRKIAPHITWPLGFVLPVTAGMRPAWMLHLGLLLYDALAGLKNTFPRSGRVRLDKSPFGTPLAYGGTGFTYSDGWVDDSRLVVLNALSAQEKGATIRIRTALEGATHNHEGWMLALSDGTTVRARVLVNATGAWMNATAPLVAGVEPAHIRASKGSHIVVKKLFDHDHAYILQNTDGRIVFAIPYEQDFTLIGTTDGDYTGEPEGLTVTDAEVDYLCTAINRHFKKQITPADVVWRYTAVRGLYDDGNANPSAVTREYVLQTRQPPDSSAVLLNVLGGKITTYRHLAEKALERIEQHTDRTTQGWTASAPLPGGDMPDFATFVAELLNAHPHVPQAVVRRMAHAYGTRVKGILDALGAEVVPGLYAGEITYLQRHEWAQTAEDILWRRTKLGLHLTAKDVKKLEAYLK
ncbi:MAG: glycerol-3-phosphate dehydrogenase [Proteobacteria bacterium]|nr:glycerol-3-phosphate dehydrogenase [Pseudomonadota bacterium]